MKEFSFARKIEAPETDPQQEEIEALLKKEKVEDPEIERIVKENSFIQEALLDFVKKDRPITLKHCLRVAEMVNRILKNMPNDFPQEDRELLVRSALVHDIGKISVDRDILFKKGKLNDEERDEIRKHARASFDYLKEKGAISEAEISVRHHEHSKGYPRNSKIIYLDERRTEKPHFDKLARVLSAFDIFESMGNTDRPYNGDGKILSFRKTELEKFDLPFEKEIISLLEEDEKERNEKREKEENKVVRMGLRN
jgi:HD-GYP domain-containing protein (c-di-GMP phosphodiesterase class II)